MKKPFVFVILLVFLVAVITACSLPGFRTPGSADSGSLSTSVVETQQFAQTQEAFSTLVAQATAVAQGTVAFPSATPTSGEVPGTGQGTAQPSASPTGPTPMPTLTRYPSMTPLPTLTKMPVVVYTSTPPATLTSVPAPSVRAEFVTDVTVPDGMKFYPSEVFTKVWRVKNTGTSTWTSNYSIVFDSGEQMNGPSPIDFGTEVKPGQMVDLVVNMKSPSSKGSYTGRWLLRTASGVKFALSNGGALTAKIEVIARPDFGSNVVYNFVNNFCRAKFSNGDGDTVFCPSNTDTNYSAVYRLFAPRMEGDRVDNEPALVMIPNNDEEGYIRGIYPEFQVQNGDSFHAVIGCLEGATRCNVKMQLNARVDGTVKYIAEWTEKEDNAFHSVSANLSSLAGKKVSFVLRVESNGDARDDKAFWLVPRIVRSAAPANTAPVLAAIGAKTVTEGTQLTFTATATDAEGQTLTYSLQNAPAGASITQSGGVFTWTPTAAQGPQTYTVRVVVSDGALTDFEDVQITVTETNTAPVLAAIGAKTVNEGEQLSFTATATDAQGHTLSYRLGAGAPAGASITQNGGVFTWTPTEQQGPGSFQAQVIVSDGSLEDSETITITVSEVNQAPTITSPGNQDSAEGAAINLPIESADADLPANTRTYTATGLPAGLSINADTGLISGTIAAGAVGSYDVTVTVSDGTETASATFTWTVTAPAP